MFVRARLNEMNCCGAKAKWRHTWFHLIDCFSERIYVMKTGHTNVEMEWMTELGKQTIFESLNGFCFNLFWLDEDTENENRQRHTEIHGEVTLLRRGETGKGSWEKACYWECLSLLVWQRRASPSEEKEGHVCAERMKRGVVKVLRLPGRLLLYKGRDEATRQQTHKACKRVSPTVSRKLKNKQNRHHRQSPSYFHLYQIKSMRVEGLMRATECCKMKPVFQMNNTQSC